MNHSREDDYRMEHPVGKFGAPELRCTGTLIALAVSLVGLVVVGIGGCLAGFMSHEELTIGCGIALVVVGGAMIVGGVVFFLYDYYIRGARHNVARARLADPNVSQDSANAPSVVYGGPSSSRHAEARIHAERPSSRSTMASEVSTQPPRTTPTPSVAAEAPPPYEAVVTTTRRLDVSQPMTRPSPPRPTSNSTAV